METQITDGKVNVRGNIVVRSKPKKADYVLYFNKQKPIAIVEAKDNKHPISYGLQQAKTYAQMLDVPFAYSSNGDGFQEFDFLTGRERFVALEDFPSPEELFERWQLGAQFTSEQIEVINQPYYSSATTYDPRYYQRNAINRTVEAIAKGQFLKVLLALLILLMKLLQQSVLVRVVRQKQKLLLWKNSTLMTHRQLQS